MTATVDNEYLDRFLDAVGPGYATDPWSYSDGAVLNRWPMCQQYAWAIPNQAAIDTLVAHSPIVEIGAGGGYWAMLARAAGADVYALDTDPHLNHWVSRGWTHVDRGGPETLAHVSPRRALFLCWPPMSAMAADALGYYRGDTVIYVGEDDGGCTGDAEFFIALRAGWRQVDRVEIPQWPGIHDDLSVWKRRPNSPLTR